MKKKTFENKKNYLLQPFYPKFFTEICSDSYCTTGGSIVLIFGQKENLTTALSQAAVLQVSVDINYTFTNDIINKTVGIATDTASLANMLFTVVCLLNMAVMRGIHIQLSALLWRNTTAPFLLHNCMWLRALLPRRCLTWSIVSVKLGTVWL